MANILQPLTKSLKSKQAKAAIELFAPDDLPMCAVFLEVADATAVIIINGACSQWRNKGNRKVGDATQGTAADRPIYQSAGISGEAALAFDSTDLLSITDRPGLDSTTFTIAAVAERTTDAGASQAIFDKWVITGEQRELRLLCEADDDLALWTALDGTATGAVLTGITASDIQNDVPFVATGGYDGALNRVSKNGANEATNALANKFNSTSNVGIGNFSAGGASWLGKLSTIVFYTIWLNATQQRILLNYLSDRARVAI